MSETEDLGEAVYDLQQYLSDRVPPLMVADSIALLLGQPVRIVTTEIHTWIAAQHRAHGAAAPVSDYLFHAVKKISLMGELDLLPKEAVRRYLQDLGKAVLEYCPEEDRDLLAQNLERLGQSSILPGSIEVLHRQVGSEQPLATRASIEAAARRVPESDRALSGDVASSFRRLSLILNQLTKGPRSSALAQAPSVEQRGELASQFVTAAAVHSTTGKELDEHLGRLHGVGIDTRSEQVLRTLGQSLPGWSAPDTGDAPPPTVGGPVDAMRRIVSLAEEPAESAKRFRELVHAAIEQFNEGYLGRAVTMFDLAEQLATDQKVKPAAVDPVRKTAHEYLSPERLRKLADSPERHAELPRVLNFFYALRPQGLLDELRGELKRDRRHFIVSLLQAHGVPARATVSERLQYSVEEGLGGESEWFLQRNLVYLLRAIPRPEDEPVEAEVALVMGVAGRSSPSLVVKEVIAYLAQTKHEKAERALITYLKVFESMRFDPDSAPYEAQDVAMLLDRTCSALARYGTPRAWRLLVDHGLKGQAILGTTMARLADAGAQDLSSARDVVDRLLAALEAELPRTVLGFSVGKNEENCGYLIQALSGTPLPEVLEALQEIVQTYPNRRLSETASKALANLASLGKARDTPATLSGDLDLFELPTLLQSMGNMRLTGVLSLLSPQNTLVGTLSFEVGKLRSCQVGSLTAPEGFYQLFERPCAGTFAFVSRKDHSPEGDPEPLLDIVPVILEGMRRYDEFKMASAIVPDQVPLVPTQTPPTPLATEPDEALAHAVWEKAASGATPLECEATIRADSYRIRRLLAHWVEEGALKAP